MLKYCPGGYKICNKAVDDFLVMKWVFLVLILIILTMMISILMKMILKPFHDRHMTWHNRFK